MSAIRDWALALLIGLMIIAFAGCTAVGLVSSNKTEIELKKLEIEEKKIQIK